jgi:hypothetical protein
MRREVSKGLILVAAALALTAPRFAGAQPMMGGPGGMPDLHAISGRPLPDRGMPKGTVTVRVARKMPANGVAGAEIVAIIKNEGGDLRKRTAKTDGSGRAMFEGLVPGDRFKAEVSVDGERLATDEFALPPEGGVRTMLIAGLGPAPAGGGAAAGGGEGEDFGLGVQAGTASPDPTLPAKTLVLRVFDEDGKPIPGHPVILGKIDASNQIKVQHGRTDDQGVARFSDLQTGQSAGYAAVIEWKGLRLGTEPFAMPDASGERAEIHALARTEDPSVITIGMGSRVVFQIQEDSLQVMEILPLENTSDKMFDPGVGAVEIPLPQGFVSAQTGESPRKLEVRQNHGIAVHGAIAPRRAVAGPDGRATGNEITFGFVYPYKGDSKEFEQPMPNGIGRFTVITEQAAGLMVSGPGVGPREARELSGRKYWVAPVEAVPPGGVLKLSITGLPSTDPTGRIVAAVLALALIAAAIGFARRPASDDKRAADSARDRLTARREALFAELVAVEKEARAGKPDGKTRRAALVGELEAVYGQLAELDEQRAL